MRSSPPQGNHFRTGVLVGGLLTLPLIILLYLTHLLAIQSFIPFDLLTWLTGMAAADDSGMIRPLAAVALFVLLGMVVGGIFYAISVRYQLRPRRRLGLLLGTLFGLPLVATTLVANMMGHAMTPGLLTILWFLLPFWVWGLAFVHVYGRFSAATKRPGEAIQVEQAITRRQFLRLAGVSGLITIVGGAAGWWLGRSRALQIAQEQTAIASLPDRLHIRIYPGDPHSIQFPEMAHERYRPQNHPIGVCFSGGGARSCSATMGQLRGLQALGLIDSIGAISAVSGGAIASLLYSFAPESINEQTLLGPLLQPEALTPANLAELDRRSIGSAFTDATNVAVAGAKADLALEVAFSQIKEADRLFARTLNKIVFEPFGLDDPARFFTLGREDAEAMAALNPGLSADNFYTMRPNRPYYIAGAAQVYPLGSAAIMRHFEYTPLYVGTPQSFPGAGPDGSDVGGGYVQSIGFDSDTPNRPDANNFVTIPTPQPPFLLSDVAASSGAAFGVILNRIEKPDWLPVFKYWSVAQAGLEEASQQSFTDGGALENLGIVPLLRRRYPLILVFFNTFHRPGESSPFAVDGIHGQISELFGLIPQQILGNIKRDIHIFPTEKFAALAEGLKAAAAKETTTYYIDTYPLIQPNSFDLAAYPDGQEVTIVWFYNSLNQEWRERLPPEVQALLESNDPMNNLANFPHYETFNQNRSEAGTPELFSLRPEQVGLLAHMWSYNLTVDAAGDLQQLKTRFTS